MGWFCFKRSMTGDLIYAETVCLIRAGWSGGGVGMNRLLLPEDIKGAWGLKAPKRKGSCGIRFNLPPNTGHSQHFSSLVSSDGTFYEDTHFWFGTFHWPKNLLFLLLRLLNVMHLETIFISASSCPSELFVLWLCCFCAASFLFIALVE